MFKSDTLISQINKNTILKFNEASAPFYSKLVLYHDDKIISDCSFKPEEKNLIKKNMQNCHTLIETLKKLNSSINNQYLRNFVALVEQFKEGSPEKNVVIPRV